MYPTIPFGPLTLPTGPILTVLAVVVALEAAGRFGKHFGLHPDDVWNTGLIALVAGLIVARVWNVVQFWYVYTAAPLLIFSPRPSGFAVWPGLAVTLLAGYAYLLVKALDPRRVAASAAVGAVAFGVMRNVAVFLTGAVVGTPSDLPWAVPYFGAAVHPVALYRAAGLLLVLIGLWRVRDPLRPARTIWLALLGTSLVHLLADAFIADAALLGGFRISQVLALLGALAASLLLARQSTDKTEVEHESFQTG